MICHETYYQHATVEILGTKENPEYAVFSGKGKFLGVFDDKEAAIAKCDKHEEDMECQVIEADAFKWLENKFLCSKTAVVTSLPDESELTANNKANWAFQSFKPNGISAMDIYDDFLRAATKRILDAVHKDSYAVFIQTDRKSNGKWFDKAYIILDEAKKQGTSLLSHKIILRKEVDKADLFRPSFSHMLIFSKNGRCGSLSKSADVITGGKPLYKNGMGAEAVTTVLKFLQSKDIQEICDPFCGHGTVLVQAKAMGFPVAIGIDIDPDQVVESNKSLGFQ